jgi:hypothetical protein
MRRQFKKQSYITQGSKWEQPARMKASKFSAIKEKSVHDTWYMAGVSTKPQKANLTFLL